MVSAKVAKENRARFHFLLVSLCIHMAIFIFMGSIVLHNMQEQELLLLVKIMVLVLQENTLLGLLRNQALVQ